MEVKGAKKSMTKEEEMLKKRFVELAEKAYQNSQFVFTSFMNVMEISLFHEAARDFLFVPYELFGGKADSERQMIRFGSKEMLGYEEVFPIHCVKVEPLLKKFSDDFTHRDFLGALMNLGIERSAIGDIFILERTGYFFCTEKMTPYIIEHLEKVKHTHVKCTLIEAMPKVIEGEKEEIVLLASSERLDGIIAKVCNVSRNESMELFREKKIFLNGRLCENNSSILKEKDVVSVRGFGKFIYCGVRNQTKKGKLNIIINKYI
ncbi:MAG TPA: YlmH/Sll1252 family protein [Lachnospiraceae bacterium]|nr:YlmH/Sll1252 family protein [Lachnospiraceae bacterium]